MLQAQHNKYLETSIKTATPTQLLIMLYDGAIRFCKLGIEFTRQGKFEDANHNFLKAQNIVKEFMITLDPDATISKGLFQLYEYFLFRLVEANTKKDIVPAEEVLGHLIDLKATWLQAAKIVQEARVGVKNA